jgi:phosphatidylglycerophosphatase A
MNKKLKWHKLFASLGGVGYLPLAPGTWGAAVGTILLLPLLGTNSWLYTCIILIDIALLTWVGAKVAHRLESEWGEDPKQYVMDEFVGVWVAVVGHAMTWQNLLLGFLLFRLFDIWKPLGIRRFERVSKGWGVMLDDVAAGVVANLILWALHFFGSSTAYF